jgi:PEP-CTERM motif
MKKFFHLIFQASGCLLAATTVSAASITSISAPNSPNWTASFGVNDAGIIVGAMQGANNKTKGYIYDGTTFTELSVPGDNGYTIAYSINNSGVVAGIYGSQQQGFIYKDGIYQTVSPNGVPQVNGLTINNNGDLAGWWADGETVRSFIQYTSGVTEILQPAPFARIYTSGLNDSGEISGRLDNFEFLETQPAFMGHPNNLSTFSHPGARLTSAGGNNNAGDLAGFYGDFGPWYPVAKIGSEWLEISIDGSTTATASDINNNRLVVGTYTLSNGVTRGFVVDLSSAVPEPSSIALLMAGALVLVQPLRRKFQKSADAD